MGYSSVGEPPNILYHYTGRGNLQSILSDGKIRRLGDTECWFCTSMEDTLQLMEMTVMREGKPYYAVGGRLRYYPAFVPEDYVILQLRRRFQHGEWVRWQQNTPPGTCRELLRQVEVFSALKLGFRGDLKFHSDARVFEVAQLLQSPEPSHGMTL